MSDINDVEWGPDDMTPEERARIIAVAQANNQSASRAQAEEIIDRLDQIIELLED